MARTKDKEREELIKRLGVPENTKLTKIQLQEKLQKQIEEDEKIAEQKALTQLIAGDVPDVPADKLQIPYSPKEIEDPFTGLSMRGLSQEAIANVIGTSQVWISKELKRIKEWQASRGKNVNQEEVVGSTASLYEEIEFRAWELYHSAEEVSDKAKSLAVVMQAREKHTKLLMDLGLIKKAEINVKHTLEVSPFIKAWKNGDAKKSLGDAIVAKQLVALEEPTPDPGIEDAEVVDTETANDDPTSEDLVLDSE
jgi:hypothetical protein